MSGRYWLWVGARLLLAVVIVGWAASYMGTGSGEKEFQKSLNALKQVRSFRVAYSGRAVATQRNELLWEVDCNRDIVHYQQHFVQNTDPPAELKQDELGVGGKTYTHNPDGSWSDSKYAYQGASPKPICAALAQGNDLNFMPPIATMIQRGVIQKGEKKTVNGMRCREWLVTMRGGLRGLEHATVCIGLEDHLPYEMTVDWDNSRTSISDYNTQIAFDLPEAAVQPTSAAANN